MKHIIQLWPGDGLSQMEKIYEAVCLKNCVTTNEGGKQLVHPFKRQNFWKCIGCILSAVTYGKKGHKLWREVPKYFGKYKNPKLRRDVH